ncbi:hypothetical protein GIB67_037499 [Kingdonia uniflora]|uniref:Uncharacterized protein n=1 Tax=Kingdonia uniflora TaxID=39325 RepID=A0A7J7KXF2_9MAGN|nr:hypothetical protein GIB67_037499 [Kingdonia uniflora]
MQGTWGLNYLNLNTSLVASPVVSPVIANELNPVLTRSNTVGKAKSKRKTASTPIIVEDVLEASEEVHDDKEQYSNSKTWSSDDFMNLACAWSQVSQSLATTNNQKAATFWFKVRDQLNSFYVDQSMWRSYNGVNYAYKGRLNKECSIFRGIIQDLESRHHTGCFYSDAMSTKTKKITILMMFATHSVLVKSYCPVSLPKAQAMTTQHHGRHEPFVPMPRWEEKTIVRTDKLEDISALEVEIVINTTLSPRQWSFDASNAHCSTLTVVADKDDFFQSG